MGITKIKAYQSNELELAAFSKALGHPARIKILNYLAKQKKCVNSDLVSELGLAQSTVSQHLKELKNIGLIQGTVSGVSMNYCIDRRKWTKAKALILEFFDKEMERWNNECC